MKPVSEHRSFSVQLTVAPAPDEDTGVKIFCRMTNPSAVGRTASIEPHPVEPDSDLAGTGVVSNFTGLPHQRRNRARGLSPGL